MCLSLLLLPAVNTLVHHITLCAAQHSTAQHSTAQHSTAQHSTAQHSTAQHSTAQHSGCKPLSFSTAQHGTARHSTAQHQRYQYTDVECMSQLCKCRRLGREQKIRMLPTRSRGKVPLLPMLPDNMHHCACIVVGVVLWMLGSQQYASLLHISLITP